jgi:hypothetical protein
VLSHGYYDAYYLKAQQVRRLIADDFRRAYRAVRRHRRTHGAQRGVQIRRKSDDPVQMYLNDIFTIAGNLTGMPAISIPCGFTTDGLPIGLQLQGDYFREARILQAAHQYQRATDWHAASAEGLLVKSGWEVVIGLETHTQVVDPRPKDLLGRVHGLRRAPNTQASAVDIRVARHAAGAEQGRVERAIRFGPGRGRDDQHAQRVRAQELLLPGPAEGLPDLAVRNPRSCRAAD